MVDYYLSKGFVLHNNIPRALNNVPQRVKHIINAEDMYKNYFVMAWYRGIPSAANTLEKSTICYLLQTEFTSTYYNNKGDKLDKFWRIYQARYEVNWS